MVVNEYEVDLTLTYCQIGHVTCFLGRPLPILEADDGHWGGPHALAEEGRMVGSSSCCRRRGRRGCSSDWIESRLGIVEVVVCINPNAEQRVGESQQGGRKLGRDAAAGAAGDHGQWLAPCWVAPVCRVGHGVDLEPRVEGRGRGVISEELIAAGLMQRWTASGQCVRCLRFAPSRLEKVMTGLGAVGVRAISASIRRKAQAQWNLLSS